MTEENEVYDLASYGLRFTEKIESNLKSAELFFMKNEYLNIEIEENEVKNAEVGEDQGISVRVIDNRGSLGFSFTNKFTKTAIEFIIKNAIAMMSAGTGDKDLKNFPEKVDQYPSVKGMYSPEIKNLELEDATLYAIDLIEACTKEEQAISQSADFSTDYTRGYIFNSNGLEASGKETSCTISSNIIVKDKTSNETSFGSDWQSSRTLDDIDATKIAQNALEDAFRNLNRVKIKSKKVPVLLTPRGTIKLLLSPIASAINAETFQFKRSFLVGKRGAKIGSDLLSIQDNGLIDNATGSYPFDGEGVPCKNKDIIRKGTFLESGLLHNSYTAAKEGVESTGNASRSSYKSVPGIGTTNFLLEPGDWERKEMLAEIQDGILLDYTGDSPNIATGDFSGLILHGNLIKNGQITNALNETMFGINLLDLFQKIKGISRDVKVFGSYHAPYVLIEEIPIIGSGK